MFQGEQKLKYQSQFAVQRNDFAIQMYITLMESWRMVISNAIRYKGQFYRYFGPPKSNKVKYQSYWCKVKFLAEYHLNKIVDGRYCEFCFRIPTLSLHSVVIRAWTSVTFSPLYGVIDHTNQIFSESFWQPLSTDPPNTRPSPFLTHQTHQNPAQQDLLSAI